MRLQSCTYEIDNYGTHDFMILAVLFKAHKIVYACACLVPHPFWPDQLKIASVGTVVQGRSHRYGWSGFNWTTFSSRLRAWSPVSARMRNKAQ